MLHCFVYHDNNNYYFITIIIIITIIVIIFLGNFLYLSIMSLGILGESCFSFLEMRKALSIDNNHQRYLTSKLSNAIIIVPNTTFSVTETRHELILSFYTINCSLLSRIFFSFSSFNNSNIVFDAITD